MNPLEWFGWLFNNLVYRPQLNLLQLYFNLTQDIGWAIILVAITVNLILWPVMVKAHISGQKMRLFGGQLREIQNKYKPDAKLPPADALAQATLMRKEMSEFQKKHGISTGSVFQVLFLQLFFASGVFYLVSDVSRGNQITGLYDFLFGRTGTSFPNIAFGWLQVRIDFQSSQYIILPIASLVLSYLYGQYIYKWAPKFDLPEKLKPKKVETKDNDGKAVAPLFDMAQFEKNNQMVVIYFLPVMSFVFNFTFPTGLNLYFATLSLFNLVRQVAITQFYEKNIRQLITDIASSDPTSDDHNPDNNPESDVDPSITAMDPVATVVQVRPKKNNIKNTEPTVKKTSKKSKK